MKINAISDLHCVVNVDNFANMDEPMFHPELDGFRFNDLHESDVLVVAGDLSIEASNFCNVTKTISRILSDKFKHIITVKGNHDFWVLGNPMTKNNQEKNSNCKILNEPLATFQKIGNVGFVCSTMWTPIKNNREFCNQVLHDFRFIPNLTVDVMNEAFDKSVTEMHNLMEKHKNEVEKFVIVTHHVPDSRCLDLENDKLLIEYVDALDCMSVNHPHKDFGIISETFQKEFNVCMWIHGHHHQGKTVKIGNTLFVRNPLGNRFDKNNNFSFDNIFEI